VFSADSVREAEALRSAELFLKDALSKQVITKNFRNGFFPYVAVEIKEYFEQLKREFSPDLILTHYRDDRHQDHRLVSDLTWNSFRDHMILEYEIPKYDGDLGAPNCFVHLERSLVDEKIEGIINSFSSQREKKWFDEETFLAVSRIRGLESNSPSKYAEGFYARKIVFS
jgi:LmbE family N-acetylglucosaminyl deacetylase